MSKLVTTKLDKNKLLRLKRIARSIVNDFACEGITSLDIDRNEKMILKYLQKVSK